MLRKKTFLVLIVFLLYNTILNLTTFAEEDPYTMAKIAAEKSAKLLTEKYGAVSVQYAMIDGDEIVISGNSGVYSKSENRQLTNNQMYCIGSTSKMFVTTVIMKLAEEGKVDLDTPVVTYLPEFKMRDERYKKITPRMLLNHSSGLNGSSFQDAFLMDDNDPKSHDQLLNYLSEQTLKAEPGVFSVYCNDGFTLAELLAERVTGQSFTTLVHQYITEPLEMEHTKTPMDLFDKTLLSKVYHPYNGMELPADTVNVIGTGGIYSNAEDLCRFSQAFLSKSPILSKESIHAMESPEYKSGLWPENSTDSSISYGLGWDNVSAYPFQRYGIQALSKGGDSQLSHAMLIVLPEYDMAAAVVSSGGSSIFNGMVAEQMLINTLKAKGKIKEILPEKTLIIEERAQMPEKMQSYAGIYASSTSQLKIVIDKDGVLKLSNALIPNGKVQQYTYRKDGSFSSEDPSEKLRFVQEKNGNTYLWSQSYQSFEDLGQMADTSYSAQKLDKNPIDTATKEAWEGRVGKLYFTVSEKYTSQSYALLLPIANVGFSPDAPGYLVNMKLMDENRAVNAIQIPGLAGRDVQDCTFFQMNGIEYMKLGTTTLISSDGVKPLYSGVGAYATIQKDGYARWFTVPEVAAGKILQVKMPKNAGFAVYDQNGMCIENSVATGAGDATLPKGGYLVFLGEVGARFELNVK